MNILRLSKVLFFVAGAYQSVTYILLMEVCSGMYLYIFHKNKRFNIFIIFFSYPIPSNKFTTFLRTNFVNVDVH